MYVRYSIQCDSCDAKYDVLIDKDSVVTPVFCTVCGEPLEQDGELSDDNSRD